MTLLFSVLDEPFIHYRANAAGRATHTVTLPGLLAALARDEVGDFPALRPHQRHPWHAFLVQLAAMALHRSGRALAEATVERWRADLLALTPDDPDGAAWCLVSPPARPALLQAPTGPGLLAGWKNELNAADELDMLVTSKNHDLKAARMTRSTPEDWLYALLSLQTQEGFLGSGNYGISRMNGGFASRPALGVVPEGGLGRRWQRDVQVLLETRDAVAEAQGLKPEGGHALLWLPAWDGAQSLSFAALDPHYIEICRRIRLMSGIGGVLYARATGSKAARVDAKSQNGRTGDAWTPVEKAGAKALTITGDGFTYKLAAELAFASSGKYQSPPAQALRSDDGDEGVALLAQSVTRGQGKTEGYHERRIPLSREVRRMMRSHHTDELAQLAKRRILAIGEVRKVLWGALCALFANGQNTAKDSDKDKANLYSAPFEAAEDLRFFDDLNAELATPDREAAYAAWLLALSERAEAVLKQAFEAGPRSGMQLYRAQSAALGRFHGSLRSEKSALPMLARLLRERSHTAAARCDTASPADHNHLSA
jgi:CRISPR system Cascade subunit CasA